MPEFDEIGIVFDATSAGRTSRQRAPRWRRYGKRLVDLTPAAIGPYVVPAVNLDAAPGRAERQHGDLRRAGDDPDRRRRSAGSRRCTTPRSSPRSPRSSAGPGTRANIDEFTETTGAAIEAVGGAARGKAIIVLNPAEPPLIMRDTVLCLTDRLDAGGATRRSRPSIEQMVADGRRVRARLPAEAGRAVHRSRPPTTPAHPGRPTAGRAVRTQVRVFLEVEGAAHYLPAYAGNLDIMTSAALRVAERLRRPGRSPGAGDR